MIISFKNWRHICRRSTRPTRCALKPNSASSSSMQLGTVGRRARKPAEREACARLRRAVEVSVVLPPPAAPVRTIDGIERRERDFEIRNDELLPRADEYRVLVGDATFEQTFLQTEVRVIHGGPTLLQRRAPVSFRRRQRFSNQVTTYAKRGVPGLPVPEGPGSSPAGAERLSSGSCRSTPSHVSWDTRWNRAPARAFHGPLASRIAAQTGKWPHGRTKHFALGGSAFARDCRPRDRVRHARATLSVADMLETMHANDGAGLAAIQIGVPTAWWFSASSKTRAIQMRSRSRSRC